MSAETTGRGRSGGRAGAALHRFRSDVGGDPLQLLVLLACFALAGYAFYRASLGPLPVRMLVWFVGAIVAHDLVLYPLYAIADRSWMVASRKVRTRVRARERAVPVVNYLRVPTLFSGLLLLSFWGLISGQGDDSFAFTSDHRFASYLGRWFVTVAVLFGVSALLYAARLGRLLHAAPADAGATPARTRTTPPDAATVPGAAPATVPDAVPAGSTETAAESRPESRPERRPELPPDAGEAPGALRGGAPDALRGGAPDALPGGVHDTTPEPGADETPDVTTDVQRDR